MFPPMPSWDGLHPLIVHFPIALLITAPVLIVLGMIFHRRSMWFGLSALTLMAIGTLAAFVSVSTGEAAGELAVRSAQIDAVLEEHEELAETTAWTFLGLTLLFAAITLLPPALRRPLKRVPATITAAVFLALYGAGTLLLANAAHQGGRLVHEFGVQALVAESPTPAAMPEDSGRGRGRGRGEDDEH